MKVESIVVKKSCLGQMMGFGMLLVIGAGGMRESFSNIEGPNISGRRSTTRLKQIPAGSLRFSDAMCRSDDWPRQRLFPRVSRLSPSSRGCLTRARPARLSTRCSPTEPRRDATGVCNCQEDVDGQ